MRNWRDDDTCPMKCPDGKLYQACGPDVQASCAFPLVPAKTENATCVEGCFCPEGLLLEGGKCVPREECPCRLRNKSFKPGTVIPKDCNTCTCQAGEWRCTKVACGARCAAVGDPHYTTFDGLKYDFMGHCTYTMLAADNVTIEVENVACSGTITEAMNLTPYKGEGKPSCTKAVTLSYGGANIHLKQGGFILVNEKEISSLPVVIGDVRIRAASSLFLIVQLPNKVDLWWDGNTRVFVDVPPEFHGKTKGLCGTFNLNQKDDFLTPENDIEQSALAFANKWKTREFCSDVDTKEPEHPCKANVENKEAAEKYCSKLKSKLFEACHDYVDVEPYYDSCVYDMCACAGDISRCLCPILGDYAMTCAKAGQLIQWRYNVKECELSCTGGQEYTVCADSCLRKCSDTATVARGGCRPVCVEGCACPPGQLLDDNGACVPVGRCPCYHKGLQFNAGYKEVRPGARERELCTCVGARWECQPATPDQIQSYPPAEDLRSNCSALLHMEFTTCETSEPLTCKNMHLPPSSTNAECRPGCQCKKGYVLDTVSKKCVLATECPCHHGGRSYPDGEVMQEECNQCECKNGNWSCTKRTCAGVCAAWGDSHLITFDGTEYDFEGVCTYLLAKGVLDSKDGFDVQIQNVPCGTTGATCSKSMTLKVGGGGDEEIVSLTKNAPIPDISKLKRIKLRMAGAYVFLDVPSLGVSLQWDRGMRVYVKVDSMWQGRIKGLCGNYNGDMRDDFQTPSGGGLAESSALIFADSWKLKPTCPKSQQVTDHCKQRPERKEWASTICGAMKRFPFTLCHAEVPPSKFVTNCERDACACDSGADCECACAALSAYAHACSLRGVTFKWRSQELCPMQCDEECSTYEPCVSACPAETCDNTLYYSDVKTMCQRDTCLEGCKPKKSCPEGTVYKNNSVSECVPRAKCKPVCMTLGDGREVLEGEILEEDACHTCRCSKKQRICTGVPCSTESPRIGSSEPTTEKPHDEPLKCVTGWTEWINSGPPEVDTNGMSIDNEPLPKPNQLQIGAPMCKQDMMSKIECRTVNNHETPKQTGLNVECSLERGLVCSETGVTCPDFEIRVYCECQETPCSNSTVPNYEHETECSMFYECAPSGPMLKTCGMGTLYNPSTFVCDWPAAVALLKPQCSAATTTKEAESSPAPPASETPTVEITRTTEPQLSVSTVRACPPGEVYLECAYPCDNLCDHFKKTVMAEGKCIRESCISGCVPEAVANIKCDYGSRWRDALTCVPLKDCTCFADGRVIKPGGIVIDGCIKCQCLDNDFHCDSSECISVIVPPQGSTHQPMVESQVTTHSTTPSTVSTIPSFTRTTLTQFRYPLETSTKSSPSETSRTSASTTVKLTPEGRIPIESTTSPAASTASTSVPPTPLIVKSTATPPPECSPDSYIELMWGDQPLPESSITASSVAGSFFAPQYAKLNGKTHDTSAGSWTPATKDTNQYIQVELPRPEPVYGVIMQGSPIFDQYVTSYEVLYGDDGIAFSTIDGPDGKPKVFRGPVNSKEPLKQMFSPPIEAKFIRVRPLTWYDEISVRLELIGCQEVLETTVSFTSVEPLECTDALGLVAELPIENIEVSSNNDAREKLNVNGEQGWTPLYSTPGEWIMFDFTSPRIITGIKTKGGQKGWVTAYKVLYTSDLSTFNPLVDGAGAYRIFPANFDAISTVLNEFRPPIHARYLKLIPTKWNQNIEMRIEPIGCFEPYPVTEFINPSTPKTEVVTCELCPGVVATQMTCPCTEPSAKHYDGENCVSRDQCPCVEAFMSYPVGSSFRGANCDDCICKLGGITDCKPAKECKCASDLVPKLSSDCDCLCEPCPPGTKICPTSKMCLSLNLWCDGVMDCTDDELNCATTPGLKVTEPMVVTTVAPTAAATMPTTVATTPKPVECPVVECPPGYFVRYTTSSPSSSSHSTTSDLPPPRARQSYQRYYRGSKGGYSKGGYSKGGYSKGGYSKGGYSKGGFSKGGYSMPQTKTNQAFQLDKPALNNNVSSTKQECPQFKCIPKLPPFRPGSTPAPVICSVVTCPPGYTLNLERVPIGVNKCPQYECLPPPERPVYCNLTGRTFNTFDGAEYKYDVCFHILARENRFDAWTVLVRKKCRVDGCLNELIVLQDDQLIIVKPNMMIEYDNYEYTVEQTRKICFQKNSFDVDQLGNGLSIKSRKYNFTVLFNKDGDIKIGVFKNYMGFVDGLCGAFDGSPHNDRRLPNGRLATTVDEFGRAWAKPGLAPNACRTRLIPADDQKRAWDLCNVITQEPFSQCGQVLNLNKWRNICLEKICACAELVVNGTKKTEEECRCLLLEQLVAECLAADPHVDLQSWRINTDCPAECPPPLVHYDCYRKRCEPACSAGGAGRACPTLPGQCFPGCYCPDGTLRQGDRCIPPAECYDCSCNGFGTPAKYVTFEGDDLPFLGNCTYLASRDRNETGQHKYEVYSTNGPCENNPEVVCTKSVHIIYEKNVIHVTKNKDNGKLVTTLDSKEVFKFPLKKEWGAVSVVNGQDIGVVLADARLEITVLQAKLEFNIKVPSFLYANRTEGLCGVCAGYQDLLLTSNGTTTDDIDEYGKSWQASPPSLERMSLSAQQCEPPPPAAPCVPPAPEHNPCYNLRNKDRFGLCHALVDPQPWVESCEADLCANATDLCGTLERYAAACRAQHVCLHDWRGQLCPYPCEAPLVYRACVDCERTCDNNEQLDRDPETCTTEPVEGCFCPPGQVRVNNTCIEPSKCFPCDAEKQHFAGDEWQEDACTKCTCSKLSNENAHVSCTTQTCATPVCSQLEDMITKPARSGQCCPEYMCVPKPQVDCEEPKKMECGFGQVLKQKTTPNGCKEFSCECKPASECEAIPSENEVEILEPGMERSVDESGCCPRVQFQCRVESCPQPPACPLHHTLATANLTGKCCPQYTCELPKDKCIVTLEWEAASKGGEIARPTPHTALKDIDAAWQDGPCRSCSCTGGPSGPSAHCSVSECPALLSSEQFVVEARPVPFECCPRAIQVACRDKDTVYKVGESWPSADNVCEQFECVESRTEGSLERHTRVQHCDHHCQPGWKYFEAEKDSGECCGKCKPVACVLDGVERPIGEKWTSTDFCTNYTCVNVNGTVQVQSANETCPEVSSAMRKQFVLEEEKVPGKCCLTQEPIACRVGNKIYQEGQTWPSSDPCKNFTCERDVTGRLTHAASVETCVRDCSIGWKYQEPPANVCCGRCVQDACVVNDTLQKPGSSWRSPDNCTWYTCEQAGEEIFVSSTRRACPDVSRCNPNDLVQEECCLVCKEKPSALSTCVPTTIPSNQTVGLFRKYFGGAGACVNDDPLPGFKECRGSCDSGTIFDNKSGAHSSVCECCAARSYTSLDVVLTCSDGSQRKHRVASPDSCACLPCGGKTQFWPTKTGYTGTKNLPRHNYKDREEYEIPDIFHRFGEEPSEKPRL